MTYRYKTVLVDSHYICIQHNVNYQLFLPLAIRHPSVLPNQVTHNKGYRLE